MAESPGPRRDNERRVTRRTVVGAGLVAATGVGAAGYGATRYLQDETAPKSRTYPEPVYGDPDREFHLKATVGEIEAAPGETIETWLYDDRYPGPEIRVEEGEHVRITLENDLPEKTSMHWHGMALPGANAMDGVPGVTQPPTEPGEEFVYEFDVTPTGTHWYHSPVGLREWYPCRVRENTDPRQDAYQE